MIITESAVQHQHAQAQAVAKIEQALLMISTGLVHRDRQIRIAILSELAGTPVQAELRKKSLPLLEALAETITALDRRLTDGISYETLFELQAEARRLFDRTRTTS